jgi:hypothetical protein
MAANGAEASAARIRRMSAAATVGFTGSAHNTLSAVAAPSPSARCTPLQHRPSPRTRRSAAVLLLVPRESRIELRATAAKKKLALEAGLTSQSYLWR